MGGWEGSLPRVDVFGLGGGEAGGGARRSGAGGGGEGGVWSRREEHPAYIYDPGSTEAVDQRSGGGGWTGGWPGGDTPAMSAALLTTRLEKITTAAGLCWNREYIKDMDFVHLTCGANPTTLTLNPYP